MFLSVLSSRHRNDSQVTCAAHLPAWKRTCSSKKEQLELMVRRQHLSLQVRARTGPVIRAHQSIREEASKIEDRDRQEKRRPTIGVIGSWRKRCPCIRTPPPTHCDWTPRTDCQKTCLPTLQEVPDVDGTGVGGGRRSGDGDVIHASATNHPAKTHHQSTQGV